MREGEKAKLTPEKKPDGERWLELLGYGHLKGQWTGYYLGEDGKAYTPERLAERGLKGRPIPAEEFDQLCGDYARPMFIGFEDMDLSDPDYGPSLEFLRSKFHRYFPSEKREN